MSDLVTVNLSAKIDVDKTIAEINRQTEEISKKVNPVKVKSTSSEVEGIKREYSEIEKVLDAIQTRTSKIYDETGRLAKTVTVSTDDYGRQLEVIKELNEYTGQMEVKQEKMTHNIKQMSDQLSRFKDSQLFKIDKHAGKSGLSKEMKELRDSVKELTVETPNLQKLQNILKDDISRAIHSENEALRAKNKELRDLERVQNSLRKFQNTQLLRIDKHTGDSPTAEMQSLRSAVAELSAETSNLEVRKDALRDAISRVIEIEKEELRTQREINKEIASAEKAQSKALWGMSKETLASRHNVSDELKHLNDWYAGLEKIDQKISKFKDSYGLKIKELTNAFGETEPIKQFSAELERLSVETPNATQKMDEMKNTFREIKMSANEGASGIQTITQSFGSVAKQALSFAGIHLSIYGVMNAIKDGVGVVNDMNAALTEVGMVTNQSVDDIANLALEYNNLAKEMNVSTGEVMDGVVSFTRQGLEQEEVMERLRATTMFSKITNLDFAQSVEFLTATVNSMNMDIERATDTFIYLGDSTATSGAEIAEGFNAVSGTANAMNLEFEKVSSWIAGISAKTREGASTIGRSLNMIIARMGKLTETGFNEEDSTQINDVAKALKSIEIDMMDEDKNFRNFADIIDEIAAKWDTLDETTQMYIGNAIAGARHQSRFFNLMEAYPETLELYEGALNSAGTTQEKFGIYAESTQAKLDTLKATIEELWLTLLNSGTIDAVVVSFTKLIQAITKLVEKFGGLTFILPTFIGLMIKGSNAVDKFDNKAEGLSVSVFKLTTKLKDMSLFTKAISEQFVEIALGSKLLLGGLAGVFGLAIAASIRYANANERNKEKILENIEVTRELVEETDKLDELYRRNLELSNTDDASKEQKEELLQVQRELAELYPVLATGLDEEGNAIADNAESIERLIEEKRELLMLQLEADVQLANSTLPELKKQYDELTRSIEMQQESLKNPEDNVSPDEVAKALHSNIERHQQLSEEIQHLESVTERYNAEIERQNEIEKWRQGELIATQIEVASSVNELIHYEQQLLSLGFSAEETSMIMAGSFDYLRQHTDLLTEAQYEQIMSTTSLDEATQIANANKLQSDISFTNTMIENAKKRIQAYIQEMQVLAELYGAANQSIQFAMSGKQGPLGADILAMPEEKRQQLNALRGELSKTQKGMADLEKARERASSALDHISGLKASSGGGKVSGKRDPSKNKKKSGGKKKPSKKQKKEYEAQENAVTQLERALKGLEFTTNRYEKLISDTKSSEKRTESIKKTTELYSQQQKMLNKINIEQRKERDGIGGVLAAEGVAKYNAETGKLTVNLSKYNQLSDENKEKVDKQIKEFDRLTNSINSNSLKWFDLKKQIREANIELVKLYTADVEDALKYLDFDLEGIQIRLSRLTEDSKEYWKNQKEELRLLGEKKAIRIEELDTLEKMYHQMDLSLDMQKDMEDTILSIKNEIRSIESTMYSIGDKNQQYLKGLADNVVSMYKDVYRHKKDMALKALDEEMKLEEERHKQAMEHYDDELSRVEEIVKAKLDELDKRVDEEKYAQKLQKEQEERQRILNEINKYGLDDSLEGKQRVSKLTEELEKQDEKIANMKYDRDVQLRKKNLQDQLNKSKEEIKDTKEKEDEKYNQLKERYDKEKEDIEEHYDFIINNEREYAAIRENIMAGHFDQVYEDFVSFVDQFANDSVYLGDVITQNITDKLEEVTGVLRVLNDMKIDTDGNATVRVNQSSSQVARKQKQSQKELINNIVWLKGKWEEADKKGDSQGKAWAKNKAQTYYADLDDDYAALLNEMNHAEAFEWYKSGQWEKVKPSPNMDKGDPFQKQQAYENWLQDNIVRDESKVGKDFSGFVGEISQVLRFKQDWHKYDDEFKRTGNQGLKQLRDRSAQDVKRLYRQMPPELARILQSMNYKQAQQWFDAGKYRNVFHTGGIVGGSGNRLTELLNQLSNQRNSVGTNERIIKALNRELMIPEINVSDKLAPNLKEGMKSNLSGNNTVNIGRLIDISEFNNKSDMDIKKLTKEAWDVTFKELGGRGFKFKR